MDLSLSASLCLALLILLFIESSHGVARASARSARFSSRYSGTSSSLRFGSTRGSGYATLSLLVYNRFSIRTSRMAYTRGIIFAPWAWRSTHPSYSEGSTICFNYIDSLPQQYNSSVMEPWLYQGRIVYGLFVCPMEEGRQDRTYCCGTGEKQTCCSFLEDPGRAAGLFIGLIIGIVFCIVFGYWCYKRFILKKAKSQVQDTAMAQATTTAEPARATLSQAFNNPTDNHQQPPPLPPSSTADGGAYFNKQPMPPGYAELPAGYADPNAPPYPVFASAPPSYWDANGGQPPQEQLPPVRF